MTFHPLLPGIASCLAVSLGTRMPTLNQLKLGVRARIEQIAGAESVVQRLLEMGMLEGEEVEVLGFAPLGDPMEILVRDYRLSLRTQEAAGVQVTVLP